MTLIPNEEEFPTQVQAGRLDNERGVGKTGPSWMKMWCSPGHGASQYTCIFVFTYLRVLGTCIYIYIAASQNEHPPMAGGPCVWSPFQELSVSEESARSRCCLIPNNLCLGRRARGQAKIKASIKAIWEEASSGLLRPQPIIGLLFSYSRACAIPPPLIRDWGKLPTTANLAPNCSNGNPAVKPAAPFIIESALIWIFEKGKKNTFKKHQSIHPSIRSNSKLPPSLPKAFTSRTTHKICAREVVQTRSSTSFRFQTLPTRLLITCKAHHKLSTWFRDHLFECVP